MKLKAATAVASILLASGLCVQAQSPPPAACDASLWSHVYIGDKRRFATPQDRLKVNAACVSVEGTIESARKEPDGDYHIRLRLGAPSDEMIYLNDENRRRQQGCLVLEPVCENRVTQADTLAEGSCTGYVGHVFQRSMLHKRVRATGAFVTDEEHGWNELHPVTSIEVLP